MEGHDHSGIAAPIDSVAAFGANEFKLFFAED
jgi:hypothetical protein